MEKRKNLIMRLQDCRVYCLDGDRDNAESEDGRLSIAGGGVVAGCSQLSGGVKLPPDGSTGGLVRRSDRGARGDTVGNVHEESVVVQDISACESVVWYSGTWAGSQSADSGVEVEVGCGRSVGGELDDTGVDRCVKGQVLCCETGTGGLDDELVLA